MEAFARQINRHASVSVHSIVFVVNHLYLRLYLRFLGMIRRHPVFVVVIIGVWIDMQTSEKPTDAKKKRIFLDKLVSRQPISFAKNAAAFF